MTGTDLDLVAAATELAPDGVLIVDADGTIRYANASMRELAGVEELAGTSVDALVPAAFRRRHHRFREAYGVAPTQRPMGSGLELALERSDGTEVPVEISLSPLGTADGFVVAIVRDITERRVSQDRLNAATQQLALVRERERIGRDLHDVVLQHLYGVGLSLQAIAAGADPVVAVRLEGSIDDVDRVISAVRTIVFTLGSSATSGSLARELSDVVAQASRLLGFTPVLRVDGPVDSVLGDIARPEVIATLREGLSNVARHASATAVEIDLAVRNDTVVLTITDDGVGPPTDDEAARAGHGLRNLRTRAEDLGGSFEFGAHEPRGARLRWTVPY